MLYRNYLNNVPVLNNVPPWIMSHFWTFWKNSVPPSNNVPPLNNVPPSNNGPISEPSKNIKDNDVLFWRQFCIFYSLKMISAKSNVWYYLTQINKIHKKLLIFLFFKGILKNFDFLWNKWNNLPPWIMSQPWIMSHFQKIWKNNDPGHYSNNYGIAIISCIGTIQVWHEVGQLKQRVTFCDHWWPKVIP